MTNFQQEVIKNIPFLRKRALKLTNNSFNADDLIQDTILRAFKYENLYKEDNLKSWLSRVMTNLFLTAYKKQVRELKRRNLNHNHLEYNYDDQIDTKNTLSKLPPETVEILQLVAKEGLSYKELAEYYNTPLGTIMSRIHRAKAKFIDEFQK